MSGTVTPGTGARLTQVLLACGVLYAALYVILNDVVAASLYDGYDPLSQAISELSATDSPARTRRLGPDSQAVQPHHRCGRAQD